MNNLIEQCREFVEKLAYKPRGLELTIAYDLLIPLIDYADRTCEWGGENEPAECGWAGYIKPTDGSAVDCCPGCGGRIVLKGDEDV